MFYRGLTKIIQSLVVIFSAVVTGIVIIEVFLRYLFGGTLYVTEELSRYLMVWVVFLASGLALKGDSHISIGILVDKFGGKPRMGINLAAQILLLIFLVFLLVEGIVVLPYQIDQIAPSMGVSFFWFYLAIPVGSVLMILFLLPKIGESIRGIFRRNSIQSFKEVVITGKEEKS